MPRRFQKGHHADDAAGYLEWATVDDEGSVSLSTFWVRSVPWLKGGKNARDVLFWLAGEGRARAFSTEDKSASVSALIEEQTSVISADASLVFYKGNFQADNSLALPDPVAAHVLAGSLTGSLWIWSHRGVVELWDETRRKERIARAVDHIAKRFDPGDA